MGTFIHPREIEGLTANDRMVANQANETFKVEAKAGHSMAENGVTLGFAKKVIGEETAKLKEKTKELYDNIWTEKQQKKVSPEDRKAMEFTAVDLQEKKAEALNPDSKSTQADVENLEKKLKDQLKNVPQSKKLETRLLECADASIAFQLSNARDGKALGAGSHLEKGKKESFSIERTETLLVRSVASYEIDQFIGTDCISPEKFSATADGATIGISVCSDGAGVREMANMPFLENNDIMMSHDFQKGMYNLEVQDYLTGQVDRHMGNIYFDPATGKLQGIDNDLALPEIPRNDMLANNPHSPVAALPMYVHVDTAKQIEQANPDKLRKTLEDITAPSGARLTKDEIDGVINRLGELKEHVKSCAIIEKFGRQTYDTAVNLKMERLQNDNRVDENGKLSAKWMNTPNMSYMGAAYAERVATLQNGAHTKEVEFPRAPKIDDAARNESVANMGTTSKAARAVISSREQVAEHQEAFNNAKTKLDVFIGAREQLQKSSGMSSQRDLANFDQQIEAATTEFATAQQNLIQAKANLTKSITSLSAPKIQEARGWQKSSPQQSVENPAQRTIGDSFSRQNPGARPQPNQQSATKRREPPKRTNRTAAGLEALNKADDGQNLDMGEKESAGVGKTKKETLQVDGKSEKQETPERKNKDSVKISPQGGGGAAIRGPK